MVRAVRGKAWAYNQQPWALKPGLISLLQQQCPQGFRQDSVTTSQLLLAFLTWLTSVLLGCCGMHCCSGSADEFNLSNLQAGRDLLQSRLQKLDSQLQDNGRPRQQLRWVRDQTKRDAGSQPWVPAFVWEMQQLAQQLCCVGAVLSTALPCELCCNALDCCTLVTASEAFELVCGKGRLCNGCTDGRASHGGVAAR